MQKLLVAIVAAFCALGCAREARPVVTAPTTAYLPPSDYGWPPPTPATRLGTPPMPPVLIAGVGVSADPTPAVAAPVVPAKPPSPPPVVTKVPSSEIPGGDRCMLDLMSAGVSFTALDEERGIDTPVEVHGPIGGISYGSSMVCDCRLALGLAKIAPVLRAAGVTAFKQTGAYSYRMSRVGRLSLHAYGLAIDVGEFVIDGKLLAVSRDFARGVDWCAPESPALNRLACRLKATGLFRELLTPDYNADHHNHFHLGIAPVEGMPKKPKPAPVRHKTPIPAVPSHEEILPPDDEPTIEQETPEPDKTVASHRKVPRDKSIRAVRAHRPHAARARRRHTASAKKRSGG